jgi:hypothetical protein
MNGEVVNLRVEKRKSPQGSTHDRQADRGRAGMSVSNAPSTSDCQNSVSELLLRSARPEGRSRRKRSRRYPTWVTTLCDNRRVDLGRESEGLRSETEERGAISEAFEDRFRSQRFCASEQSVSVASTKAIAAGASDGFTNQVAIR